MTTKSAATYPVGTIAKLLMISDRQVQHLTSLGVIPKAERGRYELAGSVQGYIRYLKDRSIGGGRDGVIDYHTEKARHMKFQADLAALELAKKQGQVTTVDQVEKMVTKAFAEVRAGMRNLPGRTVSMLIGETDERRFKQVLMEEIDAVLESLAEADLYDEEDPDEEADEIDEEE
jgi:phage terminase Nu1 subunit (DNA packaging protein)